jgi:hypothetical protein
VDGREWHTFANVPWHNTAFRVPKIDKIIPASLVGLSVSTLMEDALFRKAFETATRGVEESAQISGSLPKFVSLNIPTESKTVYPV